MRVLLNRSTLEQMAEDTSPDMMPTMIEVYLAEINKRSEQIDMALSAGDFSQLAELAHAVKSASGTFGAERLYDQAKLIELEAKSYQEKTPELAQRVKELQASIKVTGHSFYVYLQTL